jgi:hypothetical protein
VRTVTVRRAGLWRPVMTWRIVRSGRDDVTRVLPGLSPIARILVVLYALFGVLLISGAASEGPSALVLPVVILFGSLVCLRPRVVLTRQGICVVNPLTVWSADWADLDGATMADEFWTLHFELTDGTVLRAWMYTGGFYGNGLGERSFGPRMRRKIIAYAHERGVTIELRKSESMF